MREENRFPFYISYHIIMALLFAFAIAFFILHGYSIRPNLNMLEEIWRTFSYVFPQWWFPIFSSAGILALFSFGSYGLLRSLSNFEDGLFKSAYLISLFLGLGIFALLYSGAPFLFIWILVPAIVQCAILAAIEWAWGEPYEKTKHFA